MQLINFSIAQLSWILRYWGYEDLCITEQIYYHLSRQP